MRKLGITLLVCGMTVVPWAALSQESAQDAAPTADDFVCALTGECGDEEAEAAADGGPRVSATRGFSLSRPNATRPAPKASPPRQRQRQATRPAQRPNRPAAAAAAAEERRVDLRLAFDSGSAALDADAEARVRAFAEALKRPQLADVRVRIEGHTDSSGGRALNLGLSRARAQAVAQFLMAQGIAAERLEVRGYGYDQPLPGRPASAGENRRVEAVRIS